jgi:hypothetical protein
LQHVIEPKMRAFLMTAADESLDDHDWLEALAMTLASKPPSSWTDHDLVVFEALVAERSQWFRRLELLYHQMQAHQGFAFEARRVTITAPDGTEVGDLVRVDRANCELVDDVLDAALGELEQRLVGSPAQALLGVLANRVMLSATADTTQDVPEQTRKVSQV